MSYTTEEIAAPSYDISEDGMKAVRKLRLTSWDQLSDYIDGLYAEGTASGGSPLRPDILTFPGRSYLRLTGVKIDPFNDKMGAVDSNGVATCSNGAGIILQYSTVDYEVESQDQGDNDPTTWLSWDTDVQQQVITHAQAGLKWASDSSKVHEDVVPGFPITIVSHTLTWHRVPDPPMTTWYGYVGKCNSSTFLGHGDETVLFSGLSKSTKSNTDGSRHSEVKMLFQARIIHGTMQSGAGSYAGWNHFLRPDNGKWDRILNQNSEKLVKTANLLSIFQYT